MSGRARRSRALVGSGIVAAAAVVMGSGIPAPGQVEEPLGPEVVYVDGFGPGVYGYTDCDGVLHTEEELGGIVFVEFDDVIDPETIVGISFSGSLADDLVDPPTQLDLYEDDYYGDAYFEIDAMEAGDLTVTIEPGIGYVADPSDSVTLEVTEEPQEDLVCEDLGTPPNDTDRQTIEVGERPVPIGFFDEDDVVDPDPLPPGEPTSTTTEPATTESTTTTTEATTTTEEETTTTTTTVVDDQQLSFGTTRQRQTRIVPDGWSTPVADGTIPAGLTYAEDEWTGAATTPGTYTFDVRVCVDQTSLFVGRSGHARRPTPRAYPNLLCLGYVDVQIAVLAPAAAPPATPLVAQAQFAG